MVKKRKPCWMVITTGPNFGEVVIKIRRWHPGYWLFFFKVSYETAREYDVPLWLWVTTAIYRLLFVSRNYRGKGWRVDE